MNALKKILCSIFFICFFIWFFGGTITIGLNFYKSVNSCINEKGFWKGFFLCPEVYKSDLGLAWPFLIFQDNEGPISLEEPGAKLLYIATMTSSYPIQAKEADCVAIHNKPEEENSLSGITWKAELKQSNSLKKCHDIALQTWQVLNENYPSSLTSQPSGPMLQYGEGPFFLPQGVYEKTKGFLNFGDISCNINKPFNSFEITLVFEPVESLSNYHRSLLTKLSRFEEALTDNGYKICQ